MNFEGLLKDKASELTKQDDKIAQFILDHPNQVSQMSSQELADACYVSRPTVSRFVKRLGLEGYASLKYLLKTKSETEKGYSPFSAVLEQYQQYVNQVFYQKSANHLVHLILNAEVIYLYGTGNEQKLSVDFMRELLAELGKKVIVFFDKGEYSYVKTHFQKGDLLILVSYKGVDESCLLINTQAQEAGVKTLALTRTSQNPLAMASTYRLFVPTDSIMVNTERTYEVSTTFYLMIEQIYLSCVEVLKGVEGDT